MDELSELEIPYEELKLLVIDPIKLHGDSFLYGNIFHSIGSPGNKKSLAVDPHSKGHSGDVDWLNHNDQNKVREVLWDLITERVSTIGDHSNDSWPYLSLTEYRIKSLRSKDPELARLQTEVRREKIGIWSKPNPIHIGILDVRNKSLDYH